MHRICGPEPIIGCEGNPGDIGVVTGQVGVAGTEIVQIGIDEGGGGRGIGHGDGYSGFSGRGAESAPTIGLGAVQTVVPRPIEVPTWR